MSEPVVTPVEGVASPIATGAPKGAKDDFAVGYAWRAPLTTTMPADANSEVPAEAQSMGFVGEDGPTLTAEIDADFIRDWNLDQVLQVKQGTTATLEIPVFGWGIEQAKLIYGDDSVVGTEDNFTVVWAGELAKREFYALELAGINGSGRLMVEGQLSSPGQTQFQKGDAQRFTVTVALFKNKQFTDSKGRAGYFKWVDQAGVVTP